MRFFLIFFLLSAPQALSKTEKAPSLEKAPPAVGQKPRAGAKPSIAQKPSASRQKNRKGKNLSFAERSAPAKSLFASSGQACALSGESGLYFEDSLTSDITGFFKNTKKRAEKDLSYIKEAPSGQCPETCGQINSYEAISKIFPVSVNKGSCSGEEAKEVYFFNKKFPFKLSQISMEKAHEDMKSWIFSLFVDPHYPFASPSKEFIESGLETACPSCSFYLDYSYKYTKEGHIDLLIKASCGDKRSFLSSQFKVETRLISRWACQSKPEEKDKI